MTNRGLLLSSVSFVALSALLSGSALAADPYAAPANLPAVSGQNGKLAAFTGSIGGDFTLGATGSFTVPLSQQWGAQVDGLVGGAGGGTYYGVGGHLFTRDPARGLLGAYASYVGWGTSSTVDASSPIGSIADITGADVGKVGVEGEAYLGRISLEGVAAYQFGTNTGATGSATVAFYPTDDLRLDLSFHYLQGPGGSLAAGVEWAPPGKSLSFFADAATASGGSTVLVGLKAYFGGAEKSLIRRQREDDPDNLLPDDLYSSIGPAYCPPGTREFDGFCDGNL
ncbi:MAG: hypothetical protein WDM84_04120 [Bauldia sp.]